MTPWTVACQTPLSMGFSRQEHWSGLPFPYPKCLVIPIPISPIRTPRLRGTTPITQSPRARKHWSWPCTQVGPTPRSAWLLPTGQQKEDRKVCWRAVLKVQEPAASLSFSMELLCCQRISEETCQLVQPHGGGAHEIWKCLHRFQGTHSTNCPLSGSTFFMIFALQENISSFI